MNIRAASHLPLLVRALDLSGKGDVLELGMGLYSTPVMHWLCELQKRRLVSYDSDPKWFKKNEQWKTNWHEVHLVNEWRDLDLSTQRWSVVLVDQKPTPRRRDSIRQLAQCADFIVVHDTEPEANAYYRYHWIYHLFKYRFDDKKYSPETSVLSNFINLACMK